MEITAGIAVTVKENTISAQVELGREVQGFPTELIFKMKCNKFKFILNP